MKNTIYDYVDWRGDLNSFDFPFNEIDYFILGQLAYVNLDNIVTYTYQDTLTLQQAFELYNQRNQMFDDIQVKALQNESHYLFEKMAKSIRYQNIQIISYINDLDKELIKQFSAMTFLLEDESLCIGFRGTDEDLVGWHEDFLMLCEKVVPAQLSSVEYLNYIAQYPYQASFLTSLKNKKLGINIWQRAKKHIQIKKGRSLLLAGHSKGGNLAMYAGCFAYQQIKERITQIYNFDGPGFQEEVMTSQEYRSMLPRIHSFIPHYSFFGIVLGHEENYSVVHSHAHGMLQH
ncbi:MAG: Mbeg1-like protein, partial [Coprobacillus sp.]